MARFTKNWRHFLALFIFLGSIWLVLEKTNPLQPAATRTSFGPKHFANEYVEINIPDGWDCKQRPRDWMCSHFDDPEGDNVKILLSAEVRKYAWIPIAEIQREEEAAGRGSAIIRTKVGAMDWIDSGLTTSQNRISRTVKTIAHDLLVTVRFEAKIESATIMSKIFEDAMRDLHAYRGSSH